MAQPPTTPIISRELVRFIPFAAQRPFRSASLAGAGTFVAEFDVGLTVTDRNQFLTGSFPGVANPPIAVGPLLDALAFTAGANGGTMLVEFAVDLSCAYRAIANTVVPSATPTNISGLRITGRFVRVTFTQGAGAGLAEFGAYVRST